MNSLAQASWLNIHLTYMPLGMSRGMFAIACTSPQLHCDMTSDRMPSMCQFWY